jgi:hypothetical protein
MLRASIFIFLLHISISISFSQSNLKPDWVNNVENQKKIFPVDSFFYIHDFIDCNDEKNYKSTKDKLILDLINKLAGKIQTSVKSVTNNNSSQLSSNNGSSFLSVHNKTSQLIVKVDNLPYENPIIWPEEYLKSEKKIFGIIAVSKSKLVSTLKVKVDVELKELEIQLGRSPKLKTNSELEVLIVKSEESFDNVLNNILLIGYVDSEFNSDSFFERLSNLQKKLDEFRAALSNKDFEDSYVRAKSYLDENKCYKAFNEFKILSRINSSDKRVIEDKQVALACINRNLIENIAQNNSNNNFVKSVELYDSLILLNPDEKELYIESRKKTIDDYFIQTFKLIDIYLEYNLSEAKKVLDGIKVFGTDQYNDRIDEYRGKINSLFFKSRMLEFRNSLNTNDFSKANLLINLIGKENSNLNKITTKLTKMGKSLNRATYKFEKNNLLRIRPNQFCLQFGATLSSQYFNHKLLNGVTSFQDSKEVISPYLNTLIPIYSIGFYKKFRIKTKISSNYWDLSKSDLLGFKFSYNDLNNQVSLRPDSLIKINLPYIYNFQLSSVFLRIFSFNYGLNSNSLKDLEKVYFSTSLGFKFPIWNFRLDFSANYLSDYKNQHLFSIEAGLIYNLNLKKNFSSKDRDYVRLKSQQWRN